MTRFNKFLLAAAVGLCMSNAFAQSAGDLMSKFQNLPPEQQQAILNAAKSQNLVPLPQNTQVTQPQTVTPVQPAGPGGQSASGGEGTPARAGGTAPVGERREIVTGGTGKAESGKSEAAKVEGGIPAAETLKPFGYDLFSGVPSTFAPATDMPAPKDYPLGPGDDIEVQLFGKQNQHLSLVVQRDGSIQFPELGPIQVNGMTFDDMREMLSDRISKQMIGIKSAITLGPLRSIRVFVLGDVNRPGSYTVSALSTITNALFASGGVAETGSLRRLELKRQGRIMASVDLYDLLLRGDTKADVRIEPGDVIFVPPVGPTVGISGEVRRPAIYELMGNEHVADLVRNAGGLIPSAIPALSTLQRWQGDKKVVLGVDFQTPAGNLPVRDGDMIAITRSLDQLRGLVSLTGHVQRERVVEWHPGLRVSEVAPAVEQLKSLPDLDYGLIIRKSQDRQRVTALHFRPSDVFNAPGSAGDPLLQERDVVQFFGIGSGRAAEVAGVTDQLRFQAREGEKPQLVQLAGAVEEPGTYPLTERMHLQDLIDAGLRLSPDAETAVAYVLRKPDPAGDMHVLAVQLKPGSPDLGRFTLESNDTLLVLSAKSIVGHDLVATNDELRKQARPDAPAMVFSISGEVKFPGDYPLGEGMTLAQALELAGGYTEPAQAHSAEITHAARDGKGTFVVLPEEVQLADPVKLAGVTLASRDSIVIRRQPGFEDERVITLQGEVKYPGSYRVRRGDYLSDVIVRAGGFTDMANVHGGVYTRVAVRKAEERQLDELRIELRKDMLRLINTSEQRAASSSTPGASSPNPEAQIALIQNISDQLASVKAIGRMAIDLSAITAGKANADVIIQDGDTLYVPQKTEEVLVLGEVLVPSAMHFIDHGSVDDYIKLSGGTTQSADVKRTYLIKADGHVIGRASGFLFGGDSVEPGDTVVVPLDTRPLDVLPLTTNLAQIMGQLAITAASVHSVGGF